MAIRRAGAIHAFDTMNHFFLIGEMIVPGSSYWNIGVGREIGDVEKDEEGVATMRTLGRNMAWLLKRLNGGEGRGDAYRRPVRRFGEGAGSGCFG